MFYYILRFIIEPLYLLFRLPKYYGRQNLKSISHGKAMIICNHRDMRDPIFIALTSNRFIHFMAKSELFKTKLGKIFFEGFLAFPVNRQMSDMKSMKRATELMDEGCVFGIFPEGTRSVTNSIDSFEKGAAFLALKAKTAILPIYIPVDNYKLFVRPRIYIGKAIQPEDYNFEGSKSAAVVKLNEMMEKSVQELREQAGD